MPYFSTFIIWKLSFISTTSFSHIKFIGVCLLSLLNTFNAIFRIRSVAAFAIHEYFQSHNYVYVHTPLITTADCEGSNQMFKITTLDFDYLPKTEDGKTDMTKDLFGKLAFVTGTGQLHGEAMALAFKKIYT